ncbi:hypothetical protein KIN20_010993 [Parelaphostrongylus tenuis]|uniref:Uncharacterized protein n=1 Tax=Parelaphostrongylus tenuis TaxID=148309 RepID=A0AAD5MSX2_PARTN|nr:hypothetical protein KIN20_010993 [Parelaphostrongylus tenuis]
METPIVIIRPMELTFPPHSLSNPVMNSISRAVTSRFNDISNKRQRLDDERKDTDFVNPSWTDPTTSSFNCFEPPELIISEEEINEIHTIGFQIEKQKHSAETKTPNNISKKVTSVVKRLSPFGSSNNLLKERDEERHDTSDEKKSPGLFKETKGRMDRIKKSFKTSERQQLIDSDDEQ